TGNLENLERPRIRDWSNGSCTFQNKTIISTEPDIITAVNDINEPCDTHDGPLCVVFLLRWHNRVQPRYSTGPVVDRIMLECGAGVKQKFSPITSSPTPVLEGFGRNSMLNKKPWISEPV